MKKTLAILVAISSLALVGCGQTPDVVQQCIRAMSSNFGEDGARTLCEMGYEKVKSGDATLEDFVQSFSG